VTAQPASLLATRRGKLLLLLLCAVQFLDVVDSSIMNVVLPSIRCDLGFSAQDLQWVLSGYLVTYGGLLLLGGRAGDLLGRRRMLMAGAASATRFPRRNRPSNPRPAPPNKRATVMRSPRLGVPAGALNAPGCHRHSSEPLAEVP
jgi:Major Facilitator Superfamily